MPLFRKKADPISARSRELNSQIAALESQIAHLNTRIQRAKPRVRSTAVPHGPTVVPDPAPPSLEPREPREPVFEQINYQKSREQPDAEGNNARYNELGVRKYDLFAAFRRIYKHMRGTPTTNPKLVSYLAAGSIKGLRPLRYEKRIARNRFIFLSIFFALILWGVLFAIFKQP